MRRSITIEDVAKAAAVSRQTVSRVINQSPRVSAAARERVEQAIATLGWVPNPAARQMAGGRNRLLLALFAPPSPEDPRGPLPLDHLLTDGLRACTPRGYRLLFEPVAPEGASAASAAQLAGAVGAMQPDGAILLPSLDDRSGLRAALEERGIPVGTLHWADHPPENPGEFAAEHLLGLGHRQIGFITGSDDPVHAANCLAGYRRALARKGSRAHRHFVAGERPDLAGALDLARTWLVPTIRPTAIITMDADAALALLHAARSLGLSVPHDLALLALHDDQALARSQPPIAAVQYPLPERFAAVCTRMIAELEGENASKSAQPQPALQLIARSSLARAPRAI